ncbi:hypothetical protein GBA52_026495 [Prunus armeniaca]|nr:hypothetical protein GBA52_026495 [Prunus armeniaca]
MVSSLMKVGDIDGAEKIVQEWESGVKFYDIRIPNLLVTAYCRQGLFEKAKSYVEKLMESGKGECKRISCFGYGISYEWSHGRGSGSNEKRSKNVTSTRTEV